MCVFLKLIFSSLLDNYTFRVYYCIYLKYVDVRINSVINIGLIKKIIPMINKKLNNDIVPSVSLRSRIFLLFVSCSSNTSMSYLQPLGHAYFLLCRGKTVKHSIHCDLLHCPYEVQIL